MKILVTGGAGFIGSNLANHLVGGGDEVRVLDDYSLGVPANLTKNAEAMKGSVTDPSAVARAVQGVEIIFHLAARSSVTMIDDDPISGEEVNVGGFLRILEAGRKAGVSRVVYASTSSMYSGVRPPHREDAVLRPGTLYEQNFYAREQIGAIYSRIYGLETVGMRFFSVYGPNEWHKGRYANLVSQFIWTMMKGEVPVIYGDGSQTRDFTHVRDVCEALVLASKKEGVSGEVFNVCTGTSNSLNDLVNTIAAELGIGVKPKYMANPLKSYVAHTLGDPQKARNMLGFQARIDLRSGIRELIELERRRA